MKSMLPFLSAIACLIAVSGCRTRPNVPSPKPPATVAVPTDPWVLITTDPAASRGNHGIYLSNGRIGTTWGAFGASDSSRCFVAGIYDDQENLVPIPLFVAPSGPMVSGLASYRQELDLKAALLTTTVARTDGSAGTIEVFLPRQRLGTVVIRLTGVARDAIANQIAPVWPFSRSANGVAISGTSRDQSEARLLYVSVQREADFSGPSAAAAARSDADSAAKIGFDSLLAEHRNQWRQLWEADIVIDGDPEAQVVVRKALFDLRQSVRPDTSDPVAPEGLAGNFYKGHVFWDADVWIFPALLLQTPDLARSLLDYRYSKLAAARERAVDSGFRGADFPWESARSGKETAPSGFSEGRHVTAGVGWAVLRYWDSTRDREWMRARGWSLLQGVCDYFSARAEKRPDGTYGLARVTGPDELQMNVDDNAYTNAMVKRVLSEASALAPQFGVKPSPQWKLVAEKMVVPYDKGRGVYLKVRGDKGGRTKQADGELLHWPAEFPMQQNVALTTFDFHRARPIRNGPAMTSSIHALAGARLGRSQEAETAFRESYRPFLRGPFLLFSEKRSLDRCVFLTGLGGLIDAVGYGFGGVGNAELSKGAPVLPTGWNRVTLRGVYREGRPVDIQNDGKTIRITESGKEKD